MGYRIKVYKENFDFSAAHFITTSGRCESLHGHNYRVEVMLEGESGADAFLYNFSDLKPLVRLECNALNHKMLLARDNQQLRYNITGEELEALYQNRRYVFPVAEVVMLPVLNTTAEELARYLTGCIRKRILELNRPETKLLQAIEVGVEEQPGQAAYYFEPF
ncbi:6-carboxytetrahydropterin synthase [Candidatus Chlorohelix sp.]|uniref:6-pyruvoyl trahydropterin synthase family protein n=1 Tax=Candidatus Chlorohelix sp. TaxID=3139201 RepID=UPI0030626D22